MTKPMPQSSFLYSLLFTSGISCLFCFRRTLAPCGICPADGGVCTKEGFCSIHAHHAAVCDRGLRSQLVAHTADGNLIGLACLRLYRAYQHIGVTLTVAVGIVARGQQVVDLLPGQGNGLDGAVPAGGQDHRKVVIRNALGVQLGSYAVMVLIGGVAGDPCTQRHQRKVAAGSLCKAAAHQHGAVLLRKFLRNGSDGIRGVVHHTILIHGDNLEALKALLPQYEGKVKCIYIVILTPILMSILSSENAVRLNFIIHIMFLALFEMRNYNVLCGGAKWTI